MGLLKSAERTAEDAWPLKSEFEALLAEGEEVASLERAMPLFIVLLLLLSDLGF